MAFRFTQRGAGLFFSFSIAGEQQLSFALAGILKEIKNLMPVWDSVEQALRNMVSKMFESEGRPHFPWPELTLTTILQRIREGYPGPHPILFKTGRLKASFTQRTHGEHIYVKRPQSMEWGSEVPYAIYHQHPSSTKRRPPVYITKQFTQEVVQIFRQYIRMMRATRRA